MRRRKRVKTLAPIVDETDSTIQTVYGDLITFIMMLFILLFVMSYNQSKKENFVTELQIRFGEQQQDKQQTLSTDALIISKIQHYIQEEKLEDYAEVVVDEQRVRLILNSPVLFDSGKAKLKKSAHQHLAGVADLFRDVLNPIVIEGHTDNIPINTPEFESNWELSFHRGFSIVKYFINVQKFDPVRLSVMGYGEYKPIDTNDTVEGRAKNRRIEINIIRVKNRGELPAEAGAKL